MKRLGLVYLTVFAGYAAQQVLTPVLPPLARQLRLTEFQLGLVITLAAAIVVVASPIWGRLIGKWGNKRVLLTALSGCVVGLLGLALTAQFVFVPAVVFGLLLLTRGVIFGAALAAVPVAGQAIVAGATTGEKERVKGIALIGAVQGLALIVGPALGGLLAGAGLLAPLYVTPALLVVVAVFIAIKLPSTKTQEVTKPPKLSPFDARLWPSLVTGFGLFLALSFLQVTLGFLIQDRLGLAPDAAARMTGWALVAAGVPFLLCQALVVPKLGWSPARLLRTGLPLAVIGFALVAPADSFAWILGAIVVLSIGLGLAVPGYTTAPTLLVSHAEQSGVAGLIGATNALTFVVGPILATSLYSASPGLPYLSGAILLAAIAVFVFVRRAPVRAEVESV
ncbi:MFS transporter [Kibdelosporangium aridum]|uniref:MFS transporter n=1 Tax=Kibdelosporangium aridum TaxID=2030 RepID=UPI0035EC8531